MVLRVVRECPGSGGGLVAVVFVGEGLGAGQGETIQRVVGKVDRLARCHDPGRIQQWLDNCRKDRFIV